MTPRRSETGVRAVVRAREIATATEFSRQLDRQVGRIGVTLTALIETRAPAEAIVFRIPRKLWQSRNHDREFVVDRWVSPDC